MNVVIGFWVSLGALSASLLAWAAVRLILRGTSGQRVMLAMRVQLAASLVAVVVASTIAGFSWDRIRPGSLRADLWAEAALVTKKRIERYRNVVSSCRAETEVARAELGMVKTQVQDSDAKSRRYLAALDRLRSMEPKIRELAERHEGTERATLEELIEIAESWDQTD